MDSKWVFLQLWREALTCFMRLEPNGDLEQRGVLASFQCWSDVNKQRHTFIAARKYFLRVEFPTAPSSRSNRQQLQRVQEAVELFDRLAAVDNAAFESLLSEFLIHRSERRTGTPTRPHVVWPTWEFQLIGTLSSGDAIESQSAVTWGQLFGCPDDPWETSWEFRAAMETLKALGLGTGGNQHNFFVSNFWQMNNLFELKAPPVVHWAAVRDEAALIKTWMRPEKRVKMRVKPKSEEAEAEALPAVYLEPELPEMTAAIARTDMTTLKLVLSNVDEGVTMLAATDDDGIYDDPVYWTWLAYAFWSKASRSSIENLTIPWINLTEAHVVAVKKVLTNSFHDSAETQPITSGTYGYVGIRKGTEFHFAGHGAGDAGTLILAENCRCRAYYDSSSLNGVAHVVVPGTGSGCGIRSLSLTLADVENDRVLEQLLKLVGKCIKTLSLDFGCIIVRQVSLSPSAVTSACPELKELRLWDSNVFLGDDLEALQTWGIQKLSIHRSDMVDGLGSCLSDPNYRMSNELVELEISAVELEIPPTRIHRNRMILFDDAYIASLIKHRERSCR